MKFCVVGSGYVGLSIAVLLSQKYEVNILEIDEIKVNQINQNISPINDQLIQGFLNDKSLNLTASLEKDKSYKDAEYIIVATPTNYDSKSGKFDTSSVENVISDIVKYNKDATIVIKSTIPVGFTDTLKNKFQKREIFFSPEFLRETKALHDNLYPSRIIIGDRETYAINFGEILLKCSKIEKNENLLLFMDSKEAEAVKLFANTYLAMRVSFFNELDSFSEIQGLSTKKIIEGVCLDPRIGHYYNNPSFGYGGYCLPKDTKQLLNDFKHVPNKIIKAVVEANETRKEFIIKSIKNKAVNKIGIYRLVMKEGSDNYRESAVLDIIKKIKNEKYKIFLYEPLITDTEFQGLQVINNLEKFLEKSDLIVANRLSDDLDKVINKVYSRDLFNES